MKSIDWNDEAKRVLDANQDTRIAPEKLAAMAIAAKKVLGLTDAQVLERLNRGAPNLEND